MDADRKRLTGSQPFTRWVGIPKRNASSSIVACLFGRQVHLRFSFSSFTFNCRIQDEPRSTHLPSLVSQDVNNRGCRRGTEWLAIPPLARRRAGRAITRLG